MKKKRLLIPELDPYGEEIWDDNRTKYDWNEIRQQRYYKKINLLRWINLIT